MIFESKTEIAIGKCKNGIRNKAKLAIRNELEWFSEKN